MMRALDQTVRDQITETERQPIAIAEPTRMQASGPRTRGDGNACAQYGIRGTQSLNSWQTDVINSVHCYRRADG